MPSPDPTPVLEPGPSAALQARVATQPTRLRILQLVWEEEMSAGDIAARFPVSFAAVSQHLGKLREAGLVAVRREGRHRYYRARRRDMGTLAVALEAMWRDRLDALRRMAERGERADG